MRNSINDTFILTTAPIAFLTVFVSVELLDFNITVVKTPFDAFFRGGGRENSQITPPSQGGTEGSVKLLLTKNPTRSFSCQVRGGSFERFPRLLFDAKATILAVIEISFVRYHTLETSGYEDIKSQSLNFCFDLF